MIVLVNMNPVMEDLEKSTVANGTKMHIKNCIKNPEKDFLCPLILSSDKTTLSEIGDLHVDAIFITLSIFNYKVNIS